MIRCFVLSVLFAIGVCSTVLTINNFNVLTGIIASIAITAYNAMLVYGRDKRNNEN